MPRCCNCGRETGTDALIVRKNNEETQYICRKCFNSGKRDTEPLRYQLEQAQEEIAKMKCDLAEAITLLAYCVNEDEELLRTALSDKLRDKVKEFIRRCEEC